MATLYLVRHGQASFGGENYDQLSSTGWQQGRLLGRWLAGRLQPGLVCGGNMQRHCETVEAINTGYGSTLPAMQVLDGLNEFDHQEVVARWRPEWAEPSAMIRDLRSFPNPAKAFQLAFEKAVARWVAGEQDGEYTESWLAFQQRVVAALDELIDLADGSDVLVVTSGGPIAVIAQHLLALSDGKTLAMNHVIANTSVSRVLYSGSRRTLSVFNNYSHLESENPALVTFR